MAIAAKTKSVAYHVARRRPNTAGLALFEDIPDAPDGSQELAIERPIELLAQAAHQHVDNVGLRIEAVVPHVRQDHRLRDDFADVAHEVLEQRELARPELDGGARACDFSRQEIE